MKPDAAQRFLSAFCACFSARFSAGDFNGFGRNRDLEALGKIRNVHAVRLDATSAADIAAAVASTVSSTMQALARRGAFG